MNTLDEFLGNWTHRFKARKKQEDNQTPFVNSNIKLLCKAWDFHLIYFKQYSCVYSVFW